MFDYDEEQDDKDKFIIDAEYDDDYEEFKNQLYQDMNDFSDESFDE